MVEINVSFEGSTPWGQFEPLPEGWYRAIARESELSASTGKQIIKVRFEILEAEFKNRSVYENYIIQHASDKAVKIGIAKLQAYCLAAGMQSAPKRTEHLIRNRPVMLRITLDKADDGKIWNRIAEYKPCEEAAIPSVAAPASDDERAPWEGYIDEH